MPVQSQSPYSYGAYQLTHFELRGHDGLSTICKHGIHFTDMSTRRLTAHYLLYKSVFLKSVFETCRLMYMAILFICSMKSPQCTNQYSKSKNKNKTFE